MKHILHKLIGLKKKKNDVTTGDLKPCPYCGGKAVIREEMGYIYIDALHKKECVICPSTWTMSSKHVRKHKKAWNRRADNVNA